MADNTLLGSRKFYKIRSLNNCFKYSRRTIQGTTRLVYTGELTPESTRLSAGIENIDENTILFVTASEGDLRFYVQIPLLYKGVIVKDKQDFVLDESQYKKINKGDTFLWVKGEFYPLSLNEIKDIEEVDDALSISYSNGDTKTISLKNISDSYNAIYPIIIDDGNITLEGLYIDGENNNIKTFDNAIKDGVKNSYVEGIGNKSTIDYQHIMGKYSKPDDNSIFIIGGGEKSTEKIDNSKNLFTVGFDGTVAAVKDVIIKKEKIGNIYNVKDIKLSDIHNVVDEDWVVVEKINPEYGGEIGRFSGF